MPKPTKEDIEQLKELLKKIGGDGAKVEFREFCLDCKPVRGFFVHDEKELNEFVKSLTDADIIMQSLSSKTINGIIKLTRREMETKDVDEVMSLELAASSALACLLALTRANYLSVERLRKEDIGVGENA